MRCRMLAGIGLVCLLIGAAPLVAQPAPPPPPGPDMPTSNANMSAQDFVAKAAISDKYELRAAKIAEERSRNPAVDAFAARMMRDHSQSSAMLKHVVMGTGRLYLPGALDGQHRGMLQQLKGVDSRQFESLYAREQVQAHEEAVSLFEAYRHNGDNPRLRRFAAEILPIIRHHLDMARALPARPQMARMH